MMSGDIRPEYRSLEETYCRVMSDGDQDTLTRVSKLIWLQAVQVNFRRIDPGRELALKFSKACRGLPLGQSLRHCDISL